MKSKHEIPNKFDHMKAHSFNFIQNEKVNSDLLHEKNVGKIDVGFYKRDQGTASVSKIRDNLDNTMKEDENVRGSKFVPAVIKQENGDIFVETIYRNVKIRSSEALTEKAETRVVTDSRTVYGKSGPQRYTTMCYIKPVPVPIWYTESVYLTIGSTRKRFEEKVYIKNKLRPYKWSENMYTEVKTMPKNITSDIYIPVEESDVHYVSLEPQQIAASAN
ncbi:hypothetical protein NQ315_010748 [Exocentrus adspersus]|uniref:Uncharacterized protein n=1 Tax=Exocentrus adspersus TaxID=1586481 RepID=A0AAV8VTU9_9CUCU|nr:hypothetical protein NQ315_010748 [Exocentrus adspersus]